MCYKMLLLMLMAELPDSEGRIPLRMLAERFQEFFVQRASQHKAEENPNRARPGSLSRKSIVAWQAVIRQNPGAFPDRIICNRRGHCCAVGTENLELVEH